MCSARSSAWLPGLDPDVGARPSDLQRHDRADADSTCCFSSWRCSLGSPYRLARRPCSCAGGDAALELQRSVTVRVMTWNIHGGVGIDGRFDLDRVGGDDRHATIPTWSRCRRSISDERWPRRALAFAVLREAVGEHGVEAKSIITPMATMGRWWSSRWPLRCDAKFTTSPCQARAAPRHRGRDSRARRNLRLVAAHFGLTIRERRQQAHAWSRSPAGTRRPTVMLGDFNEWFWPASLRGALGASFRHARAMRRFRPGIPSSTSTDLLLAAGSAASFVDRSARRVSDHLPVIA